MIVINFKTYQQASGQKALDLARLINDVAQETGVEIVACPQAVDLKDVVAVSRDQVWLQHLNPEPRGRSTGWFPVEVAKEAGASGTLLNHSEHKLTLGRLAETLARCRQTKLKTLVLADSLKEAKLIAKLKPDYIGYEPPELIASKATSVARSQPEVIEKVVRAIPEIPILVGAGVKDYQDVRVSLERGAKAVGVASAVVLADDPKKVLLDLAKGFK